MAANARLRSINPDEKPVFSNENIEVVVTDKPEDVLEDDDALVTTNPDGSVVVDFNKRAKIDKPNSGFYSNLADDIEEGELERISSELMGEIENDARSREEWLQIRTRGIELLGYRIEDPRGDLGTSSAPLEGMATVRHPILSEAVLRFQANARGELLPASGPVKVRADVPPVPEGQTPGPQQTQDLADALEKDFNHYLTTTASEYYPDTDRMLFWIGFGGLGIKKVYNCPIRRRPVSESINAEDLIVSNAAVNLQSSGRVTHRIKMRPSILKRMQLVGAYRDVDLPTEVAVTPQNILEKKTNEIQGIKPQNPAIRPQDQDQEIYETYCELDIDGYEHKDKGEVTGLRLPYKVSIHVPSQKVLEVRRNWLKDDKLYMPREYFVDFAFVPAFGFYPLGLVHILGNTAMTLTAAWREMVDNGMFSNFPGFIYSKQAGRQLSNQFRVPPGGGIGLDTGGGSIKDSIMPLPYKDVSAAFSNFIQHVEEYGQKLGSTAEMNIGEGKQEAPVGTTLALIEQATKLMDAVHKRLHAAQAKEFQLLKERFKEDPEAFWRYNKRPSIQWDKQQFMDALENSMVVPVADPNNPTSLHRIAKATAIKQLQMQSPNLYDPMAIDKRIMKITGVDPDGLFLQTPAPSPPDPRLEAIKAKGDQELIRAKTAETQARIKAASAAQTSEDKAADRESRERIEAMKIGQERLRILNESIIHAHDEEKAQIQLEHNMRMKEQETHQKLQQSALQHAQKMQQTREKAMMDAHVKQQTSQMDLVGKAMETQAKANMMAEDLENKAGLSRIAGEDKVAGARDVHMSKVDQSREAHESKMRQQDEAHSQKLKHTEEMHKANLKAAKAQAKLKPKPAPKGGKK